MFKEKRILLASDPPVEGKNGLLLGGRISSNDIIRSQVLIDGCSLVGMPDLKPVESSTFVITSADYCNREGEPLKYNQEFLLALSSSLDKKVSFVHLSLNIVDNSCSNILMLKILLLLIRPSKYGQRANQFT